MKRVALVFGILLAFIVAGLVLFLSTFDADRYRPLLVAKLQEALGRPVTLERIALGWQGGVALQCRGLSLSERTGAASEPLLQVESASALVRLWPLLPKQLEIASIVLTRPRIHVVRNANGTIDLGGLALAAGPVAAPSRAAGAGEAAVSLRIESLRIEDGMLHWSDATASPPAELWVKRLDVHIGHIVSGQPMEVRVEAAVAGETPNLRASGRLTLPGATDPGSLEEATISVDRLALDRLLPPAQPGEVQLRGVVTGTLRGGASTLNGDALAQALAGRGTVHVDEPVIVNLNVLREVFERLSMIPGLVQRLESRLPPEYQSKLAARDTALSPLEVSMEVQDGSMRFGTLDLRSDAFRLAGAGRVGLDGGVAVRATLRIEPVLSAAIIRSVTELQALTTQDGELEIPLTIQGRAPQVAVLPDLNHVASKVIATRAIDVLGRVLERHRASSDAPQESEASSGTDLLGRFLERALQREAPSESSPQ